jgi:hypothetical protein
VLICDFSGTESGSDTMSSASALSAEGSEDWGQSSLRVLRSPSPSSDDTLGGPPCQPLPLPDLRSPDSIERDVAEKEWKLAEVLLKLRITLYNIFIYKLFAELTVSSIFIKYFNIVNFCRF